MSTPSQLAANQANAQLSTGPVTDAGKAASSKNALTFGLTGRTVLLPTDDAEAYRQHHAVFENAYCPGTPEETELCHRLADTRWRLDRIATLETGLYSLGAKEFSPLFESDPDQVRAAMLLAHTHRAYEKTFRNLALQEVRLRRLFDKDVILLTDYQAIRLREAEPQLEPALPPAQQACALRPAPKSPNPHAQDLDYAALAYLDARQANRSFDPSLLGFEFSLGEIVAHLEPRQQNISTAA